MASLFQQRHPLDLHVTRNSQPDQINSRRDGNALGISAIPTDLVHSRGVGSRAQTLHENALEIIDLQRQGRYILFQ